MEYDISCADGLLCVLCVDNNNVNRNLDLKTQLKSKPQNQPSEYMTNTNTPGGANTNTTFTQKLGVLIVVSIFMDYDISCADGLLCVLCVDNNNINPNLDLKIQLESKPQNLTAEYMTIINTNTT